MTFHYNVKTSISKYKPIHTPSIAFSIFLREDIIVHDEYVFVEAGLQVGIVDVLIPPRDVTDG